MKASWALEHFGNLLSPVERPEAVDPTKSYRLLGARWYAQGLFIKDEKSGQSIKANTLYKVQSGDFVYNRLFAWKGSFAIADAISDACHVSNEFPCFAINKRKLNPHFLKWWFSRESAWNKALGLSTGATPTSRNRLKEAQLLAMEISLPPLAEQDRIVRRIDELVKRVEEARRLRGQLDSEINLLPRGILASDKSGRTIKVGQFAALRAPDVTVKPTEQYDFAGVYCFGRGVFPSVSKVGSEFAYPRLTRLRAGNFVYPKLMAWEGALGMVPLNCHNLVVSTEFPVFEINEEIMMPEVIDTYFRSPEVWPSLSGQSGGTNVRRRRLNPQDFLKLEIPWPSREAQIAIRNAANGISRVLPIQAEVSAGLDALIPAILNKAFAGEL